MFQEFPKYPGSPPVQYLVGPATTPAPPDTRLENSAELLRELRAWYEYTNFFLFKEAAEYVSSFVIDAYRVDKEGDE